MKGGLRRTTCKCDALYISYFTAHHVKQTRPVHESCRCPPPLTRRDKRARANRNEALGGREADQSCSELHSEPLRSRRRRRRRPAYTKTPFQATPAGAIRHTVYPRNNTFLIRIQTACMFDRWHSSMAAMPDADVKYMLLLLLLLRY